jgi:hypothetical protein
VAPVRRFSAATAVPEPAVDAEILDEDRVRDQLSAAEELLYVGHGEPALVATGAALEGALRLNAAESAGPAASAGALLEAELAAGGLDDIEHEMLFEALAARDRLIHGFEPEHPATTQPGRIEAVQAIAIRLLERSGSAEAIPDAGEDEED